MCQNVGAVRSLRFALLLSCLVVAWPGGQSPLPDTIDKTGDKWVEDTLRKMSLDEKVGQLLVPAVDSTYLSSDTDAFDRLAAKIQQLHVGGFHVFGGTERAPNVLLDSNYGTVILGQPLAAASLLNRLQALSALPLLNTADFEAGVGFRIEGATLMPRQMAVGAAGDEQLAFEAARITAIEARAIGVHVNFSPLADVNNNPRNPVINIRSFGEQPDAVGKFASAYVRGLHAGGMLATLKHFPGHGDTDVDSHLGLPIITQPRERLDTVELPPFRAGISVWRRRRDDGTHRAARARRRRLQSCQPQPADRHRPAARRAEVRRPRLYRLDGHGRGRAQALARRRRGRAPSRPATTSFSIRPTMPPRSRR